MTDADRELVQRVARGMGWRHDDAQGWIHPDGRLMEWQTFSDRWEDERSVRVGWNPLTDANADLQVLEWVRATWGGPQADVPAARRWPLFGGNLLGAWERRGIVAHPPSIVATRYRRGDYARAFDAVLTSTMGATDDK